MFTIIIFILVLGLLVLVHEFGHFITALKTGMKVEEFGVGLPPRLLGFYKDPKTNKIVWIKGSGRKSNKNDNQEENKEKEEFPNIIYSLNLLPLGGFCKIKGEDGGEETAKDSFSSKSASKRILVLSAGVIMNFILAAILLGVGFVIGLPIDVSQGIDKQAKLVNKPQIIIEQVQANSPAEQSGLQFGDRILKIDQQEINNISQMIGYIKNKPNQVVELVVQRGQEKKKIEVVPQLNDNNEAKIGVLLAQAAIVRYPWYIAIYKGFVGAGITLINIFIQLGYLLANLIVGHGLVADVAGPVGIARIIGDSARLGINYLLNVTAMISLSLVAINILPFPALDGGRILFILIEKIRGKKISLKYEQLAHTIGYILLMLLVLVVTIRDLLKVF